METQRRFAVMGDNAFKVANKLIQNQKICRLLKYPVRDPLSPEREDVDGYDLIHKQIIITPKLYDGSAEKMSYIVFVFDGFRVNQLNTEYKLATLRFDIACPYDEWVLDDNSLRPYVIMQEIDNMFNQAKLSGIGNLEFVRAVPLTLSPQLGGYSMEYKTNEFN